MAPRRIPPGTGAGSGVNNPPGVDTIVHTVTGDGPSYEVAHDERTSPLGGRSVSGNNAPVGVGSLNRQDTTPHSSPDPHTPNSRVGRGVGTRGSFPSARDEYTREYNKLPRHDD